MAEIQLKAPAGMFRVIGCDTFEPPPDGDYFIGDYSDLSQAVAAAESEGGVMNRTYVYDEDGKQLAAYGTA